MTLALGTPASLLAGPTAVSFEGLLNAEDVNGYYSSGFGSLGTGPGPQLGVTFENAQALRDFDAGGTGNFANEPSPSTVLYFLSTDARVNVPAGFIGPVSVWYSSINASGTFEVYSGLNGTGVRLAIASLPALGSDIGGGDPNGAYNRWAQVTLPFVGIGRSIRFGGIANQIAFDNLNINTLCLADITGLGGVPIPPDGQMTVDDVISYVNAYSEGESIADVTGLGGLPALPDLQVTVDDLIAFVSSYSSGCEN